MSDAVNTVALPATAAPETLRPAYAALSERAPSARELRLSASLAAHAARADPPESEEQTRRKDEAVAAVAAACAAWARAVAREELRVAPAEQVAAGAAVRLLVSGSHRLGARDARADVDAVLAAPLFCTQRHFFARLPAELRAAGADAEPLAVEDAIVPLLCFSLRGVPFDLTLARVPRPESALADCAAGAVGLDAHAVRALNGPRNTDLLLRLTNDTDDSGDTDYSGNEGGNEGNRARFLLLLRCLRRWARARGLYGNKAGYLGGVNCAILAVFICQLFPRATPAALLRQFFRHMRDWKWPAPVALLATGAAHSPPGHLRPWPAGGARDVMPVLTPAHPSANSAASACTHSLRVLTRELTRGAAILEPLFRRSNREGDEAEADDAAEAEAAWTELFAPTDFFARYAQYAQVDPAGGDEAWTAFVDARARRLVDSLGRAAAGEVRLFAAPIGGAHYVGFDPASGVERGVVERAATAVLARFRTELLDGYRGAPGPLRCALLAPDQLPTAALDVLGGRRATLRARGHSDDDEGAKKKKNKKKQRTIK
jgi:poly(A) polymerase